MSLQAITDTGRVVEVDDYAYRGVGLPEGWRWMDDVDPALARLEQRISELEERLQALEAQGNPDVRAREEGW